MNFANNLTVLRILLIPFFVGTLLYYTPDRDYLRQAAILIFLIACLTDAVDGYVARQFNQKTVLGSYIDPLADKLLLLCGFLSLSLMKHLPDSMRIPAWVTIPVVTRDIIILIGSAMIFLTTGKFTARPIVIGKVTTFFQMATLLTVLLGLTSDIQFLLFVATVSLTVLSGIQYFRMATNLLGTE